MSAARHLSVGARLGAQLDGGAGCRLSVTDPSAFDALMDAALEEAVRATHLDRARQHGGAEYDRVGCATTWTTTTD